MFIDQIVAGKVEQAQQEAAVAKASGERPIRSLAKAVSWRVTGTVDTIILSYLFTGQIKTAISIGLTEVVTKMVLYYAHERMWNRISLGRETSVPSVVPSPVAVPGSAT